MLKESSARKGFFEHAEFLELRKAIPEYLKGFVTFAYVTGWRVSEIIGLTWNQVDLDEGIVRLEPGDPKNEEARTVYFDNELTEVFKKQWQKRKKSGKVTPFVFPNIEGISRIKDFRWRLESGLQESEDREKVVP